MIKKLFIKLYSKMWYSVVLSLGITFIYFVAVFSLKLLSENLSLSFFYTISSIYSILITILMIGLMIAPSYKLTSDYLNEGVDRIITFEIQAFEINSKNTYKKQDTYRKLKKIKTTIANLTTEERLILLNYFEAKNSSPIPAYLPIISSFLLGILGSSITGYYNDSPLLMLGILYIVVLLFGAPAVNWIQATRQRNLTEQYIINTIKTTLNN
ncbi:hypothetical protein [Listeria swaminathanii]|uniref:Uncharacterized protein n=1 Tax=Listeria swaminathanii TaxID=2713501 RepID=A0A7X0ZYS4_9LIST|nr:hypothetical protein [Listeria swaminathanii]MBC2328806.1 hypothetical protein [Listeria swaminathanii]